MASSVVAGPSPPGPTALPDPSKPDPGPSRHPALPSECQAGQFFGIPPIQGTSGTVLAAAEVASRKAALTATVAAVRSTVPLAAGNLEHWLDTTGTLRKMAALPFLDFRSGVPSFLNHKVRPKLEAGITARLQNTSHPGGSLLPPGTVRFLQWQDSIRCKPLDPGVGGDLAIALGGFIVHSAVWVSAAVKSTSGLVFKNVTYTVKFQRWCVQVYDCYDWNLGSFTQFLVPPPKVPDAEKLLTQFPPSAWSRVGPNTPGLGQLYQFNDNYFRDLEVSGGGKAYLVYTEPFAAPSSVMYDFEVTI